MQSASNDRGRKGRIIEITLDEAMIRGNTPEIEHERKIAIADILDGNSFNFKDAADTAYRLHLSVAEKRLSIAISNEDHDAVGEHVLPLSPFSRLIKDYFLVCESYFEAIRSAPPARIEALDSERRRLHDEGSTMLIERLKTKITIDFETARRLFTLICALHWKGGQL
jgi:uncharacterized protein (UPF0262 family)